MCLWHQDLIRQTPRTTIIGTAREMEKRGYHLDQKQCDPLYQGQHCLTYKQLSPVALTMPIYPEYDQGYKHVCLTNLTSKRILLTFQRS